MSTPTRPALRYYGGKWRLAPWIISHFPAHTCYVEPYAGAASVLLRKRPSKIEVLNDLNGDVVNFFRVLRDRFPEFERAVTLTPYSREEYALSLHPAGDPLERARRFYVKCWQSFGSGGGKRNNGWRFQRSDNSARVVDGFIRIEHLADIVHRLRQVQIERDDALSTLERFDTEDTLFYVDPPYLHSQRHETANNNYQHEMTPADHAALAEVLHVVDGMVVLSGYANDQYQVLYGGWERVTKQAYTNGGGHRTECLWLSPAASKRRLPLFRGLE